MLECACGARARDTSKERGRFNRRHGKDNCAKARRREVAKQLALGTKSAEPTTWEEHKEARGDA